MQRESSIHVDPKPYTESTLRWGELSQELMARISNPALVSLFFVSYVLIMLLVLLPGFIGLCMDWIIRAGEKFLHTML
jgi:hypothetical protein